MTVQKSFQLDPGTTGKNVSDIQIAVMQDDDGSQAIFAANVGDAGSGKAACPSHCPNAQKLLEASDVTITLQQNDNNEFQLVANGGNSYCEVIYPWGKAMNDLLN
jgi:hypothetical protein